MQFHDMEQAMALLFSRRITAVVLIAPIALFFWTLYPLSPASASEEKTFTNSLGMEFVYIESGTFMMGSPEDEPLRSKSEILHEVTIGEAFYMQTTPVTLGQWREVMGKPWFFSRKGCEDTPVTRVSCHDAMSFINELNQRGEGRYRLPTEAEWEYAARAGTTSAYPWGDETDCTRALYANNPLKVNDCVDHVKSIGLIPGEPGPVKTYPPNPWGLYDMHGNVWEWTADCYGSYTEQDKESMHRCSRRVRRGGSWFGHGYQVRSANRAYAHPAAKFRTTGFRLVKEAP